MEVRRTEEDLVTMRMLSDGDNLMAEWRFSAEEARKLADSLKIVSGEVLMTVEVATC